MLDDELKIKLLIEHRPWENEPTEEEWVDEKTNLPCRIQRHPDHLHLCGYVGVGKDHPLFGKTYDDALDLEVHGGLTYSDTEDDGIHWFGFDCAHAGDLSPGILTSLFRAGYNYCRSEEYRTWDYVKSEVLNLAKQLGGANKC